MNIKFSNISFLIHPLLFGIFPILFLFNNNIAQISISETITPILISICTTIILIFLMTIILKNRTKAGIIVSIISLLFYSYGHFLEILKSNDLFFTKYVDQYLLFAWCAIITLSVFLVIKTKRKLIKFTSILNVIAVSLVLIFIINITSHELTVSELKDYKKENGSGNIISNPVKTNTLPDIYYIILDGYANNWTLKKIYNYNNNDFTNFLIKKGFYIASKSHSNYAHTFLSLASSLNMEYINYLTRDMDHRSKNLDVYIKVIENNKVVSFLKSMGYSFVNYSSGTTFTNKNKFADLNLDCGKLDEFLIILMQTTILAPFLKGLGFFELARRRILNTFTEIAKPKRLKKPIFTFAHIISPHPPYLFNKNGLPVSKADLKFIGYIWKAKRHYIDQLIFINKKVKELINNILSNYNIPPVIILQADHGTQSLVDFKNRQSRIQPKDLILKERFRILNAYLLPGGGKFKLYESITPVNTFRLIFNHYFSMKYKVLDDKGYYSTFDMPNIFYDVTDKVIFH